jgi:hypothetical protein
MPFLKHNKSFPMARKLRLKLEPQLPAIRTVSMRPLLAISFLFLVASLSASDIQVIRVWPSYQSNESFEHVSEFFSGMENTTGHILLRSQPDTRAGYYFLTRFKNSGANAIEARVEVQLILPDSPKTLSYRFDTHLPKGNHVLNIGLTGKDWPVANAQPVAWQVRLLTPDGQELAKHQSFTWALPAK